MAYYIKELAKLAGISVRTLHYYDEIGLLKPSNITESGYRLYEESDLIRLQQIMFFKEMDLPLKEIRHLMDNPKFDGKEALEAHRKYLTKKQQRLSRIIQSIDRTLLEMEGELNMTNNERFKAFDMKEIENMKNKYRDEVREKYSKESVAECEKRTDSYKELDWQRIQNKGFAITEGIASLMDQGYDSPDVQKLVADYRQFITDNFYNCTPEIFRGLGDLYVCDERFTMYYEKYRDGLAEFMKKAMHYYCDQLSE